MQVTFLDSRPVTDEVEFQVTDSGGVFMVFTLEQLQQTAPDPAHGVITSFSDSSGQADPQIAIAGWHAARARAVEEGLIPPEGD